MRNFKRGHITAGNFTCSALRGENDGEHGVDLAQGKAEAPEKGGLKQKQRSEFGTAHDHSARGQ